MSTREIIALISMVLWSAVALALIAIYKIWREL